MSHAGMLRLLGQDPIKNLRGLLLICESLVSDRACSQQRQRIKDRSLSVLAVTQVDSLHSLLVSKSPGSVIEPGGIFIESVYCGDVVSFTIGLCSYCLCFFSGGPTPLQF